MDKIKAWFLSGNTVAKVGAIILFFGVGFLIKYASDRGILPIELRLAAVTLAAIGTLIAGWKLRAKNALFGQILQGTAIGVLYLTIFGAFKLYHLLPAGMAFGLMLLISVATRSLPAVSLLEQRHDPGLLFGVHGDPQQR